MEDEVREDLIRLRDGSELRRLLLEVNEERRADGEKQQRRRDAQQAVGPDRLGGVLLRGRGEVALHHRLVGAVAEDLAEDAANDDDPDRVPAFGEIPLGLHQVEFALHAGGLKNRAPAAVNLADDNQQRRERAAKQHDRLQHIRPDHRLDAAEHGVERAQHTHRDDAPAHIPAGDRRERHRRQQDDDAHPAQLEHREAGAAEFSQATAETHLEVFVNARDVQSPIKRQETINDQRHHQHDRHVEKKPRPVRAERLGRDGEERDRAELRRENTQAGRPPHDAFAGDKIVVDRFAAARKPKAHPDEHGHVTSQHNPVDRAEGLLRLGQVDLPNVGRADARAALAGGDNDRAAPRHRRRRDVAAGGHALRCAGRGGAAGVLREISKPRPAIGHRVVQQHVAAEADVSVLNFLLLRFEGRCRRRIACGFGGGDLFGQAGERDETLAVCAAENKQLICADRGHRAGHHAARLSVATWQDVVNFFPLAALGVELVGVAEHAPVTVAVLHSAAENVEAVRGPVVLRAGEQVRPRRAVPWR